jgi:hypothetical protein
LKQLLLAAIASSNSSSGSILEKTKIANNVSKTVLKPMGLVKKILSAVNDCCQSSVASK